MDDAHRDERADAMRKGGGGLLAAAVLLTTGCAFPAAGIGVRSRAAAPGASHTTVITSASKPASKPPPKILVVGDSVALTLGGGIQRWGARNRITVHNGGALGCTLMDDNLVITYSGVGRRPADSCRTRETWPVVLRKFRPDLVIALFGAWDVYNMSWDGGHNWSWAGRSGFDKRYLRAMGDASQRLASDGAHVLWLTPPCFGPHPSDDNPRSPWYDRRRVAALGKLLHTVAAATHESVSDVVQTAGCPVDYKNRPDGVHFSTAGANAMMSTLGPVIRRNLRT
jgi:hypothetical protein